ncbi:MAG: SUMF1/EgtB/PvdO family nonheme iron enzyme [Planctomycetes bacterium]|nr:SUMF1/EgtB/PvdO family nonheme iron enzyme [Planctomycetota bacterium]
MANLSDLMKVRSLRAVRELEYVRAQLPFWLEGRIRRQARRRPNPRLAVYRPAWYVDLDGASAQWYRDAESQLQAVRPDGAATGAEVEQVRPPADRDGAPLAWWVSREELPRLVLEGSPGGGKTVFLTRLAAAIGSACLGGPSGLEGLDLAPLHAGRRGTGIPIVVDAVRIAREWGKTPNRTAVVASIRQEFQVAGVSAPSEREVDVGLAEGRYLLLVDSWDEVAEPGRRADVLGLLKEVSGGRKAGTRIVLATRSAEYTGGASFGPEMELVKLQPLSGERIAAFLEAWIRAERLGPADAGGLWAEVTALADRIRSGPAEDRLLGNPLMLTAACSVQRRHPRLPKERSRLCNLLVEDLCDSIPSEDPERGWVLRAAAKRDILERLALRMLEKGTLALPIGEAEREVPTPDGDVQDLSRAETYLQWTADHTGLLVYEDGGKELRFRHRVFRDFLGASRLAHQAVSVQDVQGMVRRLFERGSVIDEFWTDVFLFLPEALRTRERAQTAYEELWRLGMARGEARKGRSLGLAGAMVVETPDVFPDLDRAGRAGVMAELYEKEGSGWPMRDRILFLDTLGVLDPVGGDPRVAEDGYKWVRIPGGKVTLEGAGRMKIAPFELAWAPVTVQEYRAFVEAEDGLDPKWWRGECWEAPASCRERVHEYSSVLWLKQLAHPNRPVTWVSLYEARAYCAWRTAHRTDGRTIRLPTEAEREWAAAGTKRREFPWGHEDPGEGEAARANYELAGVGEPTPVGAFPGGSCGGIVDLAGNVWEWCSSAILDHPGPSSLLGGSFLSDSREMLRGAEHFWEAFVHREESAGLRLALAPGTR